MKNLKKEIENVKSEMEVINAISVYDFTSDTYLYKDKEFKSFTDSFDKSNCFSVIDFMFWETEDANLFVKRTENNLVITELTPDTFTNNVLLDLNIKKICSQL